MMLQRTSKHIFSLACLVVLQLTGFSQNNLWHGIERTVHYKPDGEDFLLVNGNRRFNRALYGSNTAFRVEAGDLPEFALYLPGMGGNLKFGLIKNGQSKWLIDANKIETRYRPGSMLYTIKDSLLGEGSILISALSLFDQEGLIVKVEAKNIRGNIQLVTAYGGATGQKFSRDGDIGADPESSFYLKPEYCRDNFYSLNKNAFTVYFGSKKPLTEEERYEIQYKPLKEKDSVTNRSDLKKLFGIFPFSSELKLSNANRQQSPVAFFNSDSSSSPALCSHIKLSNGVYYFLLSNTKPSYNYNNLSALFEKSERQRVQLANRIKVVTPDSYINTLGGALSMAADAIWEDPSYMHGAVAWRMRLNGWRGAYTADVLGWHDRAKKHFSSYALSQLTSPLNGPVVMDTALHLARGLEKLGTSLFSSGYISRNPGGDFRPHHYDMNLVFVDQLLNHFLWTGDTAYLRKMWPLLVRHLDWEKRNFDRDVDGLYDSYAAIWASDALQYSGGGVTHSSAYNYKANKIAARLAVIIGENGERYQKEADRIFKAMNSQLWMKDKGWFAEYKDLLGNQLLHPSAGVWTVYHTIDSYVPDAFQSYQMLRYVDEEIPHIPIKAKGLSDSTLYTISTTNWQPYTWSLNNVALSEILHTSLAYWQGGRSEEAYKLWRSSLVESMYIGASPGNFQQLSFYDAIRGELYRDFADVIGMASRSLVEGLFGIQPDLLQNKLNIKPGFPAEWNYASLTTPDIVCSFKRNENTDFYRIETMFGRQIYLSLQVKARLDNVESILVNGKPSSWYFDSSSVGAPLLAIHTPAGKKFSIEIKWKGSPLERVHFKKVYQNGEAINLVSDKANFAKYFDPQKVIMRPVLTGHSLRANITATEGVKTFFVQVNQGACSYWLPVSFTVKATGKEVTQTKISSSNYDKIDIASYFNDQVNNIFKNQYLSPRAQTTTLQLPTQGIGNWAYPLTTVNISDSGLRKRAGDKNEIIIEGEIPLTTPSRVGSKNIVFTSQWDNYPKEVSFPLNGKSSHAYFLMTGTTNPMQSRFINGEIIIEYTDGSNDTLQLENPENWWPIEQDYYEDGFAFTTNAPRPLRVYLKTGEASRTFDKFITIRGFSNRGIDGGAATVLDMPLNPSKELKSLRLKAIANDVVIGLMSVTLVR
jgi:hypothetical protein